MTDSDRDPAARLHDLLGEIHARARRADGRPMSVASIASRVRMSVSAVHKVLMGNYVPRPHVALALAEAMGATQDEGQRVLRLAEQARDSRTVARVLPERDEGLPAVFPPVAMVPDRGRRNSAEVAGDTYITINGSVDHVQLPTAVAAAAARQDALDPDAALQQLSQALHKARVKAGKPLLKTLARAINYSESMLSRVFTGKRVPPRDKLEALAEQLNIDTRAFNTIWMPLWEAASGKRVEGASRTGKTAQPAAAPAGPPAVSETFVCAACKALVRLADAPDHIAWHVSLGQDQFRTASVTPLRSV